LRIGVGERNVCLPNRHSPDIHVLALRLEGGIYQEMACLS
jgi:hypothetical protein